MKVRTNGGESGSKDCIQQSRKCLHFLSLPYFCWSCKALCRSNFRLKKELKRPIYSGLNEKTEKEAKTGTLANMNV